MHRLSIILHSSAALADHQILYIAEFGGIRVFPLIEAIRPVLAEKRTELIISLEFMSEDPILAGKPHCPPESHSPRPR